MNETGDINSLSLKLEPTLDALKFSRSPRTIKTNANDLQQYAGDYELGGAIVKVSVKTIHFLHWYPDNLNMKCLLWVTTGLP